MIRPVTPGDLWTLRRKPRSQVWLYNEAMLAHPHRQMWFALRCLLEGSGRDVATFIYRERGMRAAAQAVGRGGKPEQDIVMLSAYGGGQRPPDRPGCLVPADRAAVRPRWAAPRAAALRCALATPRGSARDLPTARLRRLRPADRAAAGRPRLGSGHYARADAPTIPPRRLGDSPALWRHHPAHCSAGRGARSARLAHAADPKLAARAPARLGARPRQQPDRRAAPDQRAGRACA